MGDLYAFALQVKTILVIVVAAMAVAGALVARGGARGPRWASVVLAVGAGTCIVVATVTRQAGGTRGEPPQLVPFGTIEHYAKIAYYRGDYTDLIVYAAGNVALFAPFGFFCHLALRRGVLASTALSAALSLTVEVLQLPIYTRTFDVDDLMLNTAGGLTGVVAATLFTWAWRRRRTRLNRNKIELKAGRS